MNNKIKQEIHNRMVALNLSKQCIKAFEEDGKIWESEGIGCLYELNKEEQDIVEKFESSHKGHHVYHVIHSIMSVEDDSMEMYSILSVSPYEEEWKDDIESFDRGIAFVYVYNKTAPELSEFGSIGIKKNIGGLVRSF